MDVERVETILVRIVAAHVPLSIHVLNVAFYADVACLEAKLELPEAQANLLKFLID